MFKSIHCLDFMIYVQLIYIYIYIYFQLFLKFLQLKFTGVFGFFILVKFIF